MRLLNMKVLQYIFWGTENKQKEYNIITYCDGVRPIYKVNMLIMTVIPLTILYGPSENNSSCGV